MVKEELLLKYKKTKEYNYSLNPKKIKEIKKYYINICLKKKFKK